MTRAGSSGAGAPGEGPTATKDAPTAPLPESLGDFSAAERENILAALRTSGWNRAEAARLLGIPRRTFYRKLERYSIQ